MKYIVDIKGEIEGDYEIIGKYEEIPQGEWDKWVISEIRCPYCFNYFDTDCYSKEELNKCPNCKADMQKGEAE